MVIIHPQNCHVIFGSALFFIWAYSHSACSLWPLLSWNYQSQCAHTWNFLGNSQKNSNFADDCLLLSDLPQNFFSHLKIVYLIIPCKHIHFWRMLKYFQTNILTKYKPDFCSNLHLWNSIFDIIHVIDMQSLKIKSIEI